MTNSLFELLLKREDLERQIRDLRTAEKNEAIARVRHLMSEHALTPADLAAKSPSTSRRSSGNKVAPKYRDPESGVTWTGRGLKPKWLSAAIEAGKSIADYSI